MILFFKTYLNLEANMYIQHELLSVTTKAFFFLMLFAQFDVFGLAHITYIPGNMSDWERYTSANLFDGGRVEVQAICKGW